MYKAYRAEVLQSRPKYKLYYFDMKGRAETIRLIFAAAGVEYTDVRVQGKDWPKLKKEMPWGAMPVLEVDGCRLGESNSINKYLASEFGLAGTNSFEEAVCDSIAQVVTDIREKFSKPFSESDEQKKADLIKEYAEVTLPRLLDSLENIIQKDSSFFLGEKMNWPDLHLYACCESLPVVGIQLEDTFSNYPKLFSIFKRVQNNDKIAAWIKKRPQTQY